MLGRSYFRYILLKNNNGLKIQKGLGNVSMKSVGFSFKRRHDSCNEKLVLQLLFNSFIVTSPKT